MPYYTILYYTILCYAMLYYTILHYTINILILILYCLDGTSLASRLAASCNYLSMFKKH